jgi:hypothetical protein
VKPSHSSLVVQPRRSSLLMWMLVCFVVALILALLIFEPALAQERYPQLKQKITSFKRRRFAETW